MSNVINLDDFRRRKKEQSEVDDFLGAYTMEELEALETFLKDLALDEGEIEIHQEHITEVDPDAET